MYSQARKAIWEAVNPHSGKKRIDEAFPKELRTRTDQTTMTIEFKAGSVWRVVGLDNPDSLVGAPPAGIVFSEFALSNPAPYAYLAPIINENGGWMDIITTPRGNNHVAKMYREHINDPEWFVQRLTIDDTNVISHDQVEKDRKTYSALFGKEAADALIQQEYWCSFEAAILGAYYGKEMAEAEQRGRILQELEAEPGVPVHTAWDLGVDDAMSIWFFQAVAGRILILDYYEAHGYGIAHYAAEVKKRRDNNGWDKGTDYVPHDARQREMGSSGHDGRAKQRLEVMIECGMKPKVVMPHTVADGISAARQILPRCIWHGPKCDDGLEALREYQTEWDDDLKVFKKTPLHNWASHAADSWRYLAIAYREIIPAPRPELPRSITVGGTETLPPGHQGVTLEDLWRSNRRQGGSRRI